MTCTGTPVAIPNLPTGTIDNLSAVLPLTIGMPNSPQTIQSSIQQFAQFLGTDALYHMENAGWIEVPDTWTYASATSITVPSDATLKYRKGHGVRYKQGGGYKYGYIIGVAATTLTVSGGSDYSVANAAITDVAYAPNPHAAVGFPDYFNYSPTWGGSLTVGNGTNSGRFLIIGNVVKWWAGFVLGSTSSVGTGPMTATNPLTVTGAPADLYTGRCLILDAGNTRYIVYADVGATSMSIYNSTVSGSQLIRSSFTSTAPFTWVTGDKISIEGEAPIA